MYEMVARQAAVHRRQPGGHRLQAGARARRRRRAHVNADVPAGLRGDRHKLLAKNPANRYATAEDLRDDLRRFRDGQPVLAESWPARGRGRGHRGRGRRRRGHARSHAARGHRPPTATTSTTTTTTPPSPAAPAGSSWPSCCCWRPAGIIFLFYKGLGAGGSDTVTVPDVHGESGVTARSTLIGKGFAVTIVSQPSATVPANIVIGTKPPAGTKAAKGSEVKVLVSSGPNGSPMPNLAGLTPDQAITQLEDLRPGWDGTTLVTQTTRETDTVDKGLIISSTPGKGHPSTTPPASPSWCRPGPARGCQRARGLQRNHATKVLTDAGYTVSTTYVYSDTVAQGKVAAPTPGGSQLKPGSNVAIQISNGPRPPPRSRRRPCRPPRRRPPPPPRHARPPKPPLEDHSTRLPSLWVGVLTRVVARARNW